MFDLILRDGAIYTGAGNPWFRGDVAVKDGRIAGMGRVSGEAGEVLDASGRAVSPGFIDLHDHSDFPLLVEREAENKIRQGCPPLSSPAAAAVRRL